MSTRYRIFLSSVQKELAEERQALKTFILNDPLLRQFFDTFLFEDIPASDRRPDNVYFEEVDRCDLYIGLFGDSYGSEGLEGISPTEEEFDRATKVAKPRIIFVKSENASGRHPKMQALIRKAGDQLIRRRFATIPELTAGVYASAEAIVNAIAHRDYSSNASVQVMLFSDRLEVWNPGSLPPSLTIESLRRPHASVPHNPLIAESLFLTRIVERARSGILDMIELCAASGLRPPEFRQDAGSFIQTLWRPVQSGSTEKSIAAQVTVSHNIFINKSLEEIAETLSVTVAQVTAQVIAQVEILLGAVINSAMSREELQSVTGIKHREHLRKTYLEPLITS